MLEKNFALFSFLWFLGLLGCNPQTVNTLSASSGIKKCPTGGNANISNNANRSQTRLDFGVFDAVNYQLNGNPESISWKDVIAFGQIYVCVSTLDATDAVDGEAIFKDAQAGIKANLESWFSTLNDHPAWPYKNGVSITIEHGVPSTTGSGIQGLCSNGKLARSGSFLKASIFTKPQSCKQGFTGCRSFGGGTGFVLTPDNYTSPSRSAVILHELGHVFGLADTYYELGRQNPENQPPSIMNGQSTTLTKDDVFGIWHSFDANVTGRTVCGPDSDAAKSTDNIYNSLYCASKISNPQALSTAIDVESFRKSWIKERNSCPLAMQFDRLNQACCPLDSFWSTSAGKCVAGTDPNAIAACEKRIDMYYEGDAQYNCLNTVKATTGAPYMAVRAEQSDRLAGCTKLVGVDVGPCYNTVFAEFKERYDRELAIYNSELAKCPDSSLRFKPIPVDALIGVCQNSNGNLSIPENYFEPEITNSINKRQALLVKKIENAVVPPPPPLFDGTPMKKNSQVPAVAAISSSSTGRDTSAAAKVTSRTGDDSSGTTSTTSSANTSPQTSGSNTKTSSSPDCVP